MLDVRSVLSSIVVLLALLGCAPSPPPVADCAASVDPRTVQLLNQYAHTVDALRGLVEAQSRLRDDAVIARRLEIDAAVRRRLHESQAAQRRVEELSSQVLATAGSDADRGRIAVTLAEVARGQGDRAGSTLPAATRESAGFRSLIEALAKRDALVREVAVLEAQIAVLDGVLSSPTAPPSMPASIPVERTIDPKL